jgi:hypothetical protein
MAGEKVEGRRGGGRDGRTKPWSKDETVGQSARSWSVGEDDETLPTA